MATKAGGRHRNRGCEEDPEPPSLYNGLQALTAASLIPWAVLRETREEEEVAVFKSLTIVPT